MLRQYCIFGGQNISYQRQDGSEVNQVLLYHFSLEFQSSPLFRGTDLLVLDLFGSDFSLNDFQFPSICELSKRSIPSSRRGRTISRLIDCDLVRSLTFPESGFLLFGAKSFQFDYSQLPSNYRTLKKGIQKGIKIFGLDLETFDYGNYLGYLPLDVSAFGGTSSITLKNFNTLPATYEIDFSDLRGAGGQNLMQINSLKILASFDGFKGGSLSASGLIDVPLTI